jgi:hypothetical protein
MNDPELRRFEKLRREDFLNPEFIDFAKDNLNKYIGNLSNNVHELSVKKRTPEEEERFVAMKRVLKEYNETARDLGIEVNIQIGTEPKPKQKIIDQKQEQEKLIQKTGDIKNLIEIGRKLGLNNPGIWANILKNYGIVESKNARNLDEFQEISKGGLPFKIEKSKNGLSLVWVAGGQDFRFFDVLNEPDANKLAKQLINVFEKAKILGSKQQESIPEQISNELQEMYKADQKARTENLLQANKEQYFHDEDTRAQRASEIYSLYKKGKINLSPLDFGHLAMIFHHREGSENYKIAFELAKKSADGGIEEAKWLQAAAEDRYLISIGRNQKWGTQFKKTANGWEYDAPLDPDNVSQMTDEMRRSMNVPIRSEQLKEIAKKYPGG